MCEGPQKTVFLLWNPFFLVIYSIRIILIFYLWSFPPKNNDFVPQVAKFHNKVTIFSKSTDSISLSTDRFFSICENLLCYLRTFITKNLPNSTICCWMLHMWNYLNSPQYRFCNLVYQYGTCYCHWLSTSTHCKHTLMLLPVARRRWEFDALNTACWHNPQTHRHGTSTMRRALK